MVRLTAFSSLFVHLSRTPLVRPHSHLGKCRVQPWEEYKWVLFSSCERGYHRMDGSRGGESHCPRLRRLGRKVTFVVVIVGNVFVDRSRDVTRASDGDEKSRSVFDCAPSCHTPVLRIDELVRLAHCQLLGRCLPLKHRIVCDSRSIEQQRSPRPWKLDMGGWCGGSRTSASVFAQIPTTFPMSMR